MAIKASNAKSVLECHAVTLVRRYLAALQFPLDRIAVDVLFDYTMSTFASNNIDLKRLGNRTTGKIILKFNGLCLFQDTRAFFEDAIPHELAHVLDGIDTFENSVDVPKPHGEKWLSFLLRINSLSNQSVTCSENFDYRSIKMMNGGMPVRCICGGLEGFDVLPSTLKNQQDIKDNALICKSCESTFMVVDQSLVPEEIILETIFIKAQIVSKSV